MFTKLAKMTLRKKVSVASQAKLLIIPFFVGSLIDSATSSEVICEKLPTHLCAFAVSWSGKRCVLENYSDDDRRVHYTCKTSEIKVTKVSGYVESDRCVSVCGVDRKFVGISSDPLLSHEFAVSLCSASCYYNCPNIIDLYNNLAAGEGVSLRKFCQMLKSSNGPKLSLLSSGVPDTDTGDEATHAPVPSPVSF